MPTFTPNRLTRIAGTTIAAGLLLGSGASLAAAECIGGKDAPPAQGSAQQNTAFQPNTGSSGDRTTQQNNQNESSISTSTETTGDEVEQGLTPNALRALNAIRKEFPEITTIGGVRPDSLPDHPSGLALDFMIPDPTSATGEALGNDIASYLREHASDLGVEYVIWQQEIWNVRRDAEGWRSMADRGSVTANHRDHVHVTVLPSSD